MSTLPFVSAAISENQSPELRIRNFTRDALPIIPDEEKSPRILRKELCDIQTDIDSMIQLLEKPIRFKKKRTQCVIDFLHLRIRLEDICTVMFQQGNFIDASSDADIHSCIRESRDDLDLLGTIVCDIIYDGVSPIAREIAERLQKWAWIVQNYIPQK